ncbi:hypothetical protein EI94DRAFT_1750308, partial [Lactarius quietus]
MKLRLSRLYDATGPSFFLILAFPGLWHGATECGSRHLCKDPGALGLGCFDLYLINDNEAIRTLLGPMDIIIARRFKTPSQEVKNH